MNTTLKPVILTLVLLGVSLPLRAQEPTPPSAFRSDRLEQMAAPIALYPDALVAQILMASTYPLEVVEAARWVELNPDLQGLALEEALKGNEWDPSVKALCGFPSVLKLMNENLTWTRDLGDAFLVQQAELMDTIQDMRRKALEAGNLETTGQQQVIQEERIIVIQPTNPEVIYVPVYSPYVVYGPSWYYPSWYYPGCYYGPSWGFSLTFGSGHYWGWGLWGGFNWSNHGCHVDPYRFNHFNSRTCFNATYSNFPTTARHWEPWQHNSGHRAGVAYKTPQVARQFGAAPGSNRPQRGDVGRVTRALVEQSDSSSRTSAPMTDRTRSGAVEQKKGSAPSVSRVTQDQTRTFYPSTTTTRTNAGSTDGTRRSGATSGGGRAGKLFESRSVGGNDRNVSAGPSAARSIASPERERASGTGRGSRSFESRAGGSAVRDDKAVGTGARIGSSGSRDLGRAGAVTSGSGRSVGSVVSGARSGGSPRAVQVGSAGSGRSSAATSGRGSFGGGRSGAVSNGRSGGSAGGGIRGGAGSRGGGKD